jgi:predicted PhzF superfamily epimerase YddE/YHI9
METNNAIGPTKISPATQAPQYTPIKENEQLLLALGLTADHIAALPMIVNTGQNVLLLEVRNQDALDAVKPDNAAISLLTEQHDLLCYCVFIRAEDKIDAILHIIDTGTGGQPHAAEVMAAGALACYLYDIAMVKKENVIIQLMDVASAESATIAIHLGLNNGKIQSWQPNKL